MILENKKGSFEIPVQKGLSILDLALKENIEWGFSCVRGTCARCRCLVSAGMDQLNEVTDAEWDRLTEEELQQGYRLACQATVKLEGELKIKHTPYF